MAVQLLRARAVGILGAENTHYNSSYLLPGFTLSRSDRGGSLVDPSSGFSQFYQLEGASADLGSDIDLLRLTANFSYVVTPAPRHRVVARTALGAVFIADDDRINLAPSLRFFAGGSQSLRAFGYQSIGGEIEVTRDNGSQQTLVVGGDRLVTGTLEYQYYFTDTWRGAVFVDAGDAFDSTDFNLKVGPGWCSLYVARRCRSGRGGQQCQRGRPGMAARAEYRGRVLSRLWWRVLAYLVLVPVLTAAFLPFTERGSRWLLESAARLLPVELTYGGGALAGEILLERLVWNGEGLRLALAGLVIELSPNCLWHSRICFPSCMRRI